MKENVPNNLEVGERIRSIRENLKMNREMFSEMIDISDVFLGQIERGERSLSIKTLSKIVELRTDFAKNNNQKSGEKLNKYYKELIGIFENYPELKANETILILQKQLEKLESEIAAARRIYVNDITSYNTLVRKIPSNLVAKIFKYQEINYPILETEEIKIKF